MLLRVVVLLTLLFAAANPAAAFPISQKMTTDLHQGRRARRRHVRPLARWRSYGLAGHVRSKLFGGGARATDTSRRHLGAIAVSTGRSLSTIRNRLASVLAKTAAIDRPSLPLC
jgi:hypothetical protein